MTEELAAYLDAYRIRRVEMEIARRYHPEDGGDSPMKCPTHLSIGAEHLAVAVARNMPAGTKAYSTHRSHAHYLAWGGDLRRMLAELHGRKTGCAGGWGGSMHLVDESAGFMGTSAIVGSSLSYAVGSALAASLEGSDRWTVAFVGDAVPETGQFWEALNFANLKDLRLLIVIEDNGLATATTKGDRQGNAIDEMILADNLAGSYSWMSKRIRQLITREVNGDSYPVVVRSEVHRYYEHVGPNIDNWRDAPEVWGADDPVKMMADEVVGNTEHDLTRGYVAELKIHDEVNAAFEQAASDPWPDDLPSLFYGGRA